MTSRSTTSCRNVWASFASGTGAPVPTELTARILREFERWTLVDRQARDLENAQRRAFRDDETADVEKLRLLLNLKAIGPMSATLFVREFFGWRADQEPPRAGEPGRVDADAVRQRRQPARARDQQGGQSPLRWMAVEIAWGWLRWQPNSALSQWYQRRFGAGNARARKVGIVALARKLLIALWQYLEQGEVPEGAEFTPWEKKLNGRLPAAAKVG